MFCPRCATQNIDGASFCRSCGANISLISQALAGELPKAEQPQWSDRYSRKKRNREPSIDEAIRGIMMGVAFTIVSILIAKYMPGGSTWWFWMLIPAFGCFGKGVSGLAKLRLAKSQTPTYAQPQLNTLRQPGIPTPKTGELMSPVSSVTEGTTRHLGAEPQTRHLEYSDTQKPS